MLAGVRGLFVQCEMGISVCTASTGALNSLEEVFRTGSGGRAVWNTGRDLNLDGNIPGVPAGKSGKKTTSVLLD